MHRYWGLPQFACATGHDDAGTPPLRDNSSGCEDADRDELQGATSIRCDDPEQARQEGTNLQCDQPRRFQGLLLEHGDNKARKGGGVSYFDTETVKRSRKRKGEEQIEVNESRAEVSGDERHLRTGRPELAALTTKAIKHVSGQHSSTYSVSKLKLYRYSEWIGRQAS